jgi:signal transduction histidine kinase
MTADQIRRAFEPFRQTGEVRTRASEGVGLGLTLARKILSDQNAVLSLSSGPGLGVVAQITFNVRERAAA